MHGMLVKSPHRPLWCLRLRPTEWRAVHARGSVEGLADALDGRIDARGIEEEAGTRQAVVPYGQSGLEMAGFNEGLQSRAA